VDFVISKVAMSVCALTVATILAGLYCPDRLFDRSAEVERVLRSFCATAEDALMTGESCTLTWEVPFASTGEVITVYVLHGTTRASDGERSATIEPLEPIRTWEPVSSQMNRTMVEELDNASAEMAFVSGEVVAISTALITVEDRAQLMVFCRPAG